MELKNWPHLADVVKIREDNGYKEQTIRIYTDGSKNKHGVGSGVAIFVGNELQAQPKFKLDNRCSNNQAEQIAIAKALEGIDAIDIAENSPMHNSYIYGQQNRYRLINELQQPQLPHRRN